MRLSISSRLLGLQRYNATLVMMDQFSKLAHMMATTGITTALETKNIFVNAWWGHHGLWKVIMSNQNPKITNMCWTYLFRKVITKLMFSTTFHSQIEGQT